MALKNCFRWRPSDDEMRAELEAHVAMRAEHDGVDQAAARKRLGNMLGTREAMRAGPSRKVVREKTFGGGCRQGATGECRTKLSPERSRCSWIRPTSRSSLRAFTRLQ